MPQDPKTIKSGDDVTRLMNLKSGDDVSDLMNKPSIPEEGIMGKAYHAITHPMEPMIDIPEMEGEGYIPRIANWTSSRVIEPMTSPAGIATLPLAGLRMGRLALGGLGAAYGAYNAPGNISKAYNDPSFENVADAALDLSMIAPGAKMAKGMIPRRKLGGTIGKEVVPPIAEDLPLNPPDPRQPFKSAKALADENVIRNEDLPKPKLTTNHSVDEVQAAMDATAAEMGLDPNFNQGMGNPELAGSVPYTPTQFSGSAPKPKYRLKPDGSYELIAPTAPIESNPVMEAFGIEPGTKVVESKPQVSTTVAQRAAHVKRILKANDEAIAADPSIPKMSLQEAQAQALAETNTGLQQANAAKNPPPNKPPKSPVDMGELPDYSVPKTPLEAGTPNPGLLGQINNFAKTTLTSYDISAPGRQALPLWHTKAFWTSWNDMFQAWGSEKAYNNIMQGIADRDLFRGTLDANGRSVGSIAERAGLDLTDIISHREERFGSKLAEKIPLVKRSERAYTAFLNKVRADHFETLYKAAKTAGRDPDKDLGLAKGLADFINTATGRGSLGKLEPHAKLLSDHLFAPRFYASRIKMLNPKWYANQDPFVRKEALKSLLALTSLSTGIATLSEMAGLDVSRDRTSSDYGKIKIGNTRLDPYAGFQQYEVLGQRLVQGTYDMYVNGNIEDYGKFEQDPPWNKAVDFATGKLNPVQSFVVAMMRGRDFDQMPFEFKKGLVSRVVPIMMQDIAEIYQDDPSLLWLAAPAAIGMGVQTYGR